MRQKFLKILSAFLIVSFCLSGLNYQPKKAEAIFGLGDIVYDPANWILNSLKIAAQYLSNLGIGLPGTGSTLRVALKGAKQPCKSIKDIYQIVNTADNFPGAEVLASNSIEITKLTARISTLTTARNCLKAVLAGSLAAETGAEVIGGLQTVEVSNSNDLDLEEEIRSLDARIDDLVKLRKAAVLRMWEGVATRIFLTAQNRLVTTLINKMIAKYRIGNYLQYADALAAQVYNIDFAKKNYPDQMDQAILKSISGVASFSLDISPQIRAKARQNLGIDFRTVDVNDPDFFSKMSIVGSGPNDPFVLNSFYASVNDGLMAAGRDAARMELAQNQGIMSLRNCQGIVQQEIDFDRQWGTLVQDVKVKDDALNNLLKQQTVNPNMVSEADIKIADEALKLAVEKMQTFPQRNGNVYVKRCQDIANPGASISNAITGYLNSHLTAANTTDQKNLPFIAKFAETVANSFISRVIQHEIGSPVNLTDGGFVSVAVPLTSVITPNVQSQILKSAEDRSLNSSLIFSATAAATAGQVAVNWDAGSIEGVSQIVITAPTGFRYSTTGSNGTITLSGVAGGTVFTINIYNSAGTVLATTTAVYPANPNVQVNLPTENTDQISIVNDINQDLRQSGQVQPPSTSMFCGGVQMSIDQCLATNDQAYCNSNCSEQGVLGAYVLYAPLNARGNVNNFFTPIR